jgi:hypothetical protein
VPAFETRERLVAPGHHVLTGRAWSGRAPVARVEVSADGGATWRAAELGPRSGAWAWVGWTFPWDATPGEHVLSSRATDEAGNTQPAEPAWNTGGYVNNAIQRLRVEVREDVPAG